MVDENWVLRYDHYDPDQQRLREALCTLGNGYFATRGAFSEVNTCETHYPGTYLAGGYNRLQTEIAGRIIENEDLVNFPNWLPLTFRIDEGEWFDLKAVEIISFEQQLDLKQGVLSRQIHFSDAHGRESLLTDRRFVHMRHMHLAAIEWSLTPKNWSGKLEVLSALDGTVTNSGVERYKELNATHLEPIQTESGDEVIVLTVETNQSGVQMTQAARTRFNKEIKRTLIEKPGYIGQICVLELSEGEKLHVEKIVSLYTSRDHAITEHRMEAKESASKAPDFASLFESHSIAWGALWRRFDMEIETVEENPTTHPLLILRIHLFHLLQTISLNTIDADVGVPARGWHGEAYRGHVFWDELFIFPTLNLRLPEITEALLKYRYRRLDRARENASQSGFLGAMYPWQSGSNGREESQKVHLNPISGHWVPDNSHIQRHVNVAIVYNVWRYYEVTENIDFLYAHGGEMVLEIARFLASLTSYDADADRYDIHGVMGPDEYHDAYPESETPGLSNNAYTNVMVVWVLCRALDILALFPADHREDLCKLLSLGEEEIARWREISEKMRVIFHEDGVISQFEGYEELEEFPWEAYREKYEDIHRLDRILEREGDSCNRYKVSKQADVLMLFYLFSAEELQAIFHRLNYPFSKETIHNTINYYIQRTSHGSTLSRIVHSWVMVRADRPRSWQLFTHALLSDIGDIQKGTTAEGIHLGAMAGTVDLIQRCYTGIELKGEVLSIDPSLPDALKRLRMSLHTHFHAIDLDISHHEVKMVALRSKREKIQISFQGKMHTLATGQSITLRY